MLASAILVALVAIVYVLPRESEFSYSYSRNKPWQYGELIAAYDFPIYKTEAEVAAERDSVLRGFQPFYRKDDMVVDEVLKALGEDAESGRMAEMPPLYMPYVEGCLREVYETGVISRECYASVDKAKSPKAIRIIEHQEAVSFPLEKLYTTRSAYEYVMQADTQHFSRELLARISLNNYIRPNLICDTLKTNAARDELLSSVSLASGMVQSGQIIIGRGEIVTAERLQILDSFKRVVQRRSDPTQGFVYVLTGQILLVLIMLSVVLIYLYLFRRERLSKPSNIYLLFTLLIIFPVATALVSRENVEMVYLIPYAMLPILVRIFLDSRTAFVTHVLMLLLCAVCLHGSPEFLLMQSVAGAVAIYDLKELTRRSQLFHVAVVATFTALLIDTAFHFAEGGNFSSLDYRRLLYLGINGVFLLFAYPLMYLIERLFGFTSSVALVEMTNINNDLLRKMSKVAQGTFNHSMQVANLAAEVANKIGAKAQLVRTGALYHDIGKISNPAFFTENQSGVNPHDSISEERSAEIIISHVTEGLKIAEKYNLPGVIKDFILTHHGKGKVKYFYIQYRNNHPGEEVDESLFTYPGPNPFTKEQAILMMCDAVEASSRSLKEFTEESISDLVNRIIDGQVGERYFENCPITFRDISDAKRVLIESLKTIYHTRISYPELKKEKAAQVPPPRAGLFGSGLYRTWNK